MGEKSAFRESRKFGYFLQSRLIFHRFSQREPRVGGVVVFFLFEVIILGTDICGPQEYPLQYRKAFFFIHRFNLSQVAREIFHYQQNLKLLEKISSC